MNLFQIHTMHYLVQSLDANQFLAHEGVVLVTRGPTLFFFCVLYTP